MPESIGFVSTRFAGTDGVSLESAKWAQVFAADGHTCSWFAGKLDREPERSFCVPEAFFGHPENAWINERIWGKYSRPPLVTARIHALVDYLKGALYDFIRRFDASLLVLENAVSLPMHLPLGIALAELLSESRMPAIAHHHDFYWERDRFAVNAATDYLDMAFPPRDPDLQHVVINQSAREELARRKAVPSVVVPNVMNFESPPPAPDAYAAAVREEIGLAPSDVMILQPSRVVPRKGIEHAVTLIQMLGDPRYKLVVSHEAGDEGTAYRDMLAAFARRNGVDVRFIATRVGDVRQIDSEGKKIFTLWDLYPHAALVTYPSLYEGFGNAFLEAIYFKIPVLVNRYAIFGRDIEPKGFRIPIMEGFLAEEAVREVKRLLEDADYRREVVEHNYRVASSYYSYAVLRRSLRTLLTAIRGFPAASA